MVGMRRSTTTTTSSTMTRCVLGLLLLLAVSTLSVEAKTQRLGDYCDYKKNCQSHVDGLGPAWAGGEVTCAVPQSNVPEACGSDGKANRMRFSGVCKLVGELEATEYGCACGVHDGNCPQASTFSRIFWPQTWFQAYLDKTHA